MVSLPSNDLPRAVARRYHFHFPFVLYVLVTLLLAIGAINSQNNLLFAALGLLIGGLLVSGYVSGAPLMGVRIERQPVGRAAVGEPLHIRYRVWNLNRLLPAFGLELGETPPADSRLLAAAAAPVDGADSPGKTHAPASHWSEMMPQPRAFVAHVGPRGSVVGEAVVRPRRRGLAALEGVRAWTTFPFGITRKSATYADSATVLVEPAAIPLRAGVLDEAAARSTIARGSLRGAGVGEEFFGLREYVPGDSPRRIAWKPTARTGTPVVRQFTRPAPRRVWIVLDLVGGNAGDREAAIVMAAAAARAASGDGLAFALLVPSAGVVRKPQTGERHLRRVIADLALLDVKGDSGRRQPSAAGSGPASTDGCVAIHASGDSRAGPRGAMHFSAHRPEEMLLMDEPVRATLAAVRAAAAEAPKAAGHTRQTRWWRRWFRSPVVPPPPEGRAA